jgi:hypothetical protein
MNKKVGIWMDSENAVIVTLLGNTEIMKMIESGVEHYHIHGGSGSSTPYGPQDAVSESKLLERKKHQENNYFDKIIVELGDVNAIAIFGPAEAKIGLKKALLKNEELRDKMIHVEAADRRTENQIMELVRNFFDTKSD